jgi:hypothetical protein
MANCGRFRCAGCAGCKPDDPLPGESDPQRRRREDAAQRAAGKPTTRAKLGDVAKVRPRRGDR